MAKRTRKFPVTKEKKLSVTRTRVKGIKMGKGTAPARHPVPVGGPGKG